MIDQKDVAKMAGVSIMTVSRVINNNGYVKEETRKRVLKAIEELNYYPNSSGRSLSNNKTNTIAAMAPLSGGAIENDPYYIRLLYGIEIYLVDHAYDILLSTQRKVRVGGEYSFDYFRPVMERKADGLILFGARLEPKHLDLIIKNQISLCVIGDRPDTSLVDIVDTDNRQGIKVIVEKLYELGHRKIAFAGCIRDSFNIMERFAGYKEVLTSRDILVREEYIFYTDSYYIHGREPVDMWLALEDRPTAVVCSTDDYALHFIMAAKERGIAIPGDISITGFDGTKIGHFIDPPLVSMRQPLEEMGQKAAELILDRLNNPGKKGETYIFDVFYQDGKSIGPPRA